MQRYYTKSFDQNTPIKWRK